MASIRSIQGRIVLSRASDSMICEAPYDEREAQWRHYQRGQGVASGETESHFTGKGSKLGEAEGKQHCSHKPCGDPALR